MIYRIAVLGTLVIAGSAQAQSPAETGTGGGPSSTIYAPNTTSVGQTKPPGNAGGPVNSDAEGRFNQIEKKNDAIQSGICIGCDK